MNKIFSKFSLLIIVGFLFISFSTNFTFAGDKTWNGSVSSVWTLGANWDGGVPASSDNAIIPTGLTNYPIISSGTVDIKDVQIDGTGSLTINGGTLNVTRKIEFLATTSPYGTITQSGGTINVRDLKFTGAGTFNQSGTSVLTVSHDYKNNGSGTFNSTGGTIQFTGAAGPAARFDTGTNQFYNVIIDAGVDPNFDNGTGGIIKVAGNYTNNNSGLDVTTAEFTFNESGDQTITSASTPLPATTTFGNLVIDKPSGTIKLLTDVAVENTFTETNGTLDENGSTLWVNGSPLPVELSSFSAVIIENRIELKWRTETEINNYGFEIDRAVSDYPNLIWKKIGFVEGHGNSNSPKEYNFLDSEVNSAGIYSYRLKQIDNDGSYEFSKTLEVNFGSPIKFELNQNYPNPFNPSTTISFTLPQSGNVALKVFNSIGEEVITLTDGFIEAGVYTFNFNADGLPSGMYIYQLNTPEKTQVRKMILMK